MRSMCYGRRSALASSVTLAAVMAAFPAEAGESLTVEQNVELAAGAVVVRVQLGGGKRSAEVRTVRVLEGLPTDVSADVSWLGLCLPDRRSLQAWPIEHSKWPARASWRRALARGHYEAVVFVESRGGGHRPRCGVEAMQMRHTDVSGGYAEYVKQVETLLRKRGAAGQP